MAKSAYRNPGLKDLSETSRAELETLVNRLVETGCVSAEVVNGKLDTIREATRESALTVAEQAKERAATYRSQYEKLDDTLKFRCSWEEVMNRLLANDGHYLHLAEAMNEKGILFGVDEQGNPLFSDRGDGPMMFGMNYADARRFVLMKKEGWKHVTTGYEMFPYSGCIDKSPEIMMFEACTGNPFGHCPKGGPMRMSWLESGGGPDYISNRVPRFSPRIIVFDPRIQESEISSKDPQFHDFLLGVRRLLRVKKS